MNKLGLILIAAIVFSACRGDISKEPPIHLNPNMDQQNRFEMQEENVFFTDGRAQRPLPEGTVAVGYLKDDDHLWRGKKDGRWALGLPEKDDHGVPFVIDRAFLRRGKARYEIYCAPCHDGTGSGQGVVVQRGFFPPPNFQDPRLLAMPVGQLYDVIANGARNMPPYGAQIQLRDRWAVAAYVRTLQLSRNASLEQIPPDRAAANGWGVQ